MSRGPAVRRADDWFGLFRCRNGGEHPQEPHRRSSLGTSSLRATCREICAGFGLHSSSSLSSGCCPFSERGVTVLCAIHQSETQRGLALPQNWQPGSVLRRPLCDLRPSLNCRRLVHSFAGPCTGEGFFQRPSYPDFCQFDHLLLLEATTLKY